MVAPVAVLWALLAPAPALVLAPARADADPGAAGPAHRQPFVDHTEWVYSAGLSSLRVYPSRGGRSAAREPGTLGTADRAWAEVVGWAPEADTPGMRAQFLCHWRFAELAYPGKTSWNLEPWRPVVDDAEMVASGCNPGGPQEVL